MRRHSELDPMSAEAQAGLRMIQREWDRLLRTGSFTRAMSASMDAIRDYLSECWLRELSEQGDAMGATEAQA